jgi:hypothetical protein
MRLFVQKPLCVLIIQAQNPLRRQRVDVPFESRLYRFGASTSSTTIASAAWVVLQESIRDLYNFPSIRNLFYINPLLYTWKSDFPPVYHSILFNVFCLIFIRHSLSYNTSTCCSMTIPPFISFAYPHLAFT